MRSLHKHIEEKLSIDNSKIVYHFSYDIVNSDDDYNELKSELEKIIDDTEPILKENICQSTIILGYDNTDFNFFEVLEEQLNKKITYCLSVVSIKGKRFEISDSTEILNL